MNDKFVHLHVHSEYSMLDGYGHPEQFVQRAKELGQPAIAITDHGNIFAHYKWWSKCQNHSIKPILGCEVYIVDNIHSKQRWNNHLTVLAKNAAGLQNINKLLSIAWDRGFYYKPRIDWDLLKQHGKGLIVLSGCTASRLANMIRNNVNDKDLIAEINRQRSCVEHYFLEVSQWRVPEGLRVASKILELQHKMRTIQAVMTMDAHYPLAENAEVQDALLAVQTGSLISDPDRMKFSQNDLFIKSREEMTLGWESVFPTLAKHSGKLLDNSLLVNGLIEHYEFPRTSPASFVFEGNKFDYLNKLCDQGMKLHKLSDREYKKRLAYEMSLIKEKDFTDYFLIIRDVVQWAKQSGIMVGFARGSSCGSLVCYLLGITEIDPLKFGLLFERFIDVNRTDLPDIDVDFQDNRREEVKRYIEQKYGKDHVASICTFGTFQGRLCVQDIGRVFEIPIDEIEKFKNMIVQRSSGDPRFGFGVEDTIKGFDLAKKIAERHPQIYLAAKLEGHVRHRGVAAAGVVISKKPLVEVASVFVDKHSNMQVLGMEGVDVPEVGLMKVDILGLVALSVMRECIDFIKLRHGKDIDIYKLPLDDPNVYEKFCAGQLVGIFQYDGKRQASICKLIQPKSFKELAALNALSRPGALGSGGTVEYIERKFGRRETVYDHPLMERISAETFGVACYQEQVMIIVRELGGFSWSDTSKIRKIMSKKEGLDSFDKFRSKFVAGCATNGIEETRAIKIWDSINTSGNWAFNKSHSVAYAMMAYSMMWLKFHYPIEFYCALLRNEYDEEITTLAINEMKKGGFDLLPLHVNKSKANFSIEGTSIRVGLRVVKGLGENICATVERGQPYASYNHLKRIIKKQSALDILFELGALEGMLLGWAGDDATLPLFATDDHKIEANDTEHAIQKYCPVLSIATPHNDYAALVFERFGKEPTRISDIAFEGESIVLVGKTNPNDFNLGNKVNEAGRKGVAFDNKGKPNDAYDYLIFQLRNETGLIDVRVTYKNYPRLKEFLWTITADDVLVIHANTIKNVNYTVFANEVVKLEVTTECPF